MSRSAIFAEWRAWFGSLAARGRWLPLCAAAAFIAAHAALGGLRADHVALAAAVLGLYYSGPRLRPVLRFLFPLVLMGAIYDAQRYWAAGLRAHIRVAEPRNWELAWFGIRGARGLGTPAEWLQGHAFAAIDVVAGAAYLLFIPVFLGCCAWWFFCERREGGLTVMWAMFWLNIAGYVTYLVYPAAPPWYVDHYGLGPAVAAAAPEAAGAARFDSLLGVGWFASIYGRNANVFGAIPSLHVGQTFLAVLFAWRFGSLRALTTGFWLLVFFGSVYLNHHYIVDGLVGMAYAVLVLAGMGLWRRFTGLRQCSEASSRARAAR